MVIFINEKKQIVEIVSLIRKEVERMFPPSRQDFLCFPVDVLRRIGRIFPRGPVGSSGAGRSPRRFLSCQEGISGESRYRREHRSIHSPGKSRKRRS